MTGLPWCRLPRIDNPDVIVSFSIAHNQQPSGFTPTDGQKTVFFRGVISIRYCNFERISKYCSWRVGHKKSCRSVRSP